MFKLSGNLFRVFLSPLSFSMNLFLRVCGAVAAAAALVAGQQPLISIPVRTPSGPVHHFNLFEGDNILNAAEAFIASNGT